MFNNEMMSMFRLADAAVALFCLSGIATYAQVVMTGAGLGTPITVSCGNCMSTPLLIATSNGPNNASNSFVGLTSGFVNGSWTTTLANVSMPLPTSGTINNLFINFPTTLLQGSWAITMNINGVSNGTLTCTVTTNSCNDATHSVSVNAGDVVAFQAVPTGTPTAQTITTQVSAVFTSTIGQESAIFAAVPSTPSNSVSQNIPFGVTTTWVATASEVNISSLLAAAGTIDNLRVLPSATSSPGSYAVTVFHNGAATSLTCTVMNASACNDLVGGHAFSVARGDTISVQATPASTPAAIRLKVSARFVPTTTNQAVIFGVATTAPVTTTTKFGNLSGTFSNTSTETSTFVIAPIGMTFLNMSEVQDVAPGGATTRSQTLRSNSANAGSVACTILSIATSCVDLVNSFSASAGAQMDIQTTTFGTNAALTYYKTGIAVTVP